MSDNHNKDEWIMAIECCDNETGIRYAGYIVSHKKKLTFEMAERLAKKYCRRLNNVLTKRLWLDVAIIQYTLFGKVSW